MEIVLKVSQGPAGRLSGTLRAADQTVEMTFSGVMELLACIEGLFAREATGPVSQPAGNPGESGAMTRRKQPGHGPTCQPHGGKEAQQ